LAADALAELGGVDILVNNAGIPKRRQVTRLDPETVAAVMAINYLSPVRLTLALLPHMVERGSGRIVNVSSVAATLSSPGEAAYVASKAALTGFSESMDGVFAALEEGAFQVYVPAYFADLAVRKAGDVHGFLSGTAAYVARQTGGA
jgi:NAD(P)-dependent dehydrogenase (short-subunit alcohol dehydrogenase family)